MEKQSEGKPFLDANYNLISEAEMLAQQDKYLSRLQDVAASCEYVNRALSEFNQLELERARKEHWEHYVTCSELPRPFDPGEMRTFLVKRRHCADIETDKSIDWTLSVDECSVLNQNIFREDRTRGSLQTKLGVNPGVAYGRDVQMCLDTLKKIEVMLDNQAEVGRMSLATQLEVFEVRGDYEREIDSLFDRLTYRVLSMQAVYMKSVDGREATWSYGCKPWTMDIWGLTNAHVRFDQFDIPAMMADLSATGVMVQMPLSVLMDCLTLRCVHTSFDSYSQNAKSYEQAIPECDRYPNAGIADIQQSLMSEWHVQLEMQEMALAAMVRRREQYLELLELIEERTEQASKRGKEQAQSKNKLPKIVVPKTPKLAPPVPEGMLPDIREAFYKREESDYKEYIDEIYHPQKLNMTADEINLRQHIMLGGIYSIMFVRRPMQMQFQKFNVVLHEDGRILHTIPDVVAEMGGGCAMPEFRRTQISQSRKQTPVGSRIRLTTALEARQSNIRLQDNELPYFIVTIQLPQGLCKWSEPLVCQYVTDMVPIDETPAFDGSEVAEDRANRQMPSSSGLTKPSRDQRSASQPVSNIFRPSQLSILRQSRLEPIQAIFAPMLNFDLVKTLTLTEMRNLQKFSFPRIISSFQFPTDFLEVELELQSQEKQKGKALFINRVQDFEEIVERPIREFEFESQHKPERIFPFFDNAQRYLCTEDTLMDRTLHGFLNTLEKIKGQYLERPKDLIRQYVETKEDKREKFAIADTEPTMHVYRRATALSHKKSHHSSKTDVDDSPEKANSSSSSEIEPDGPMKEVVHWTTKHIVSTTFDREANTITFTTDRLGIFGLAFKRYEHFPFRDWSLQPNEENPDEIILQLDTYHVRVFLYITAKGVRGYATDLGSAYTAKPVKYLEIVEPISDFRDFRKIFLEKNINIFAENDASFYIGKGYFSIKHVAAELHTYDVMALHCKLIKFYRSSWNRLASRRDIIVGMKNAKDPSDYSEVTMRVTPDSAKFVKISELCSDDVNVIRLEYEDTWRNVTHFTDLHQAVCSMNASALDMCNKDTLLLFFIRRLLGEIRVLSYS
ncbi:uncharacterized protein LOC108153417 isoform X2 [Drosophila miranda]|uniref:uncharacterized protein LOC108153417 isoform X2 n=1 Tax=Drosophila miranda TaxID=7229 RepID=UPI0007E6706D|nr:uncharacterized protein LOC108153417 isoform X2 [Drosophila miranda]